ncbi:hypothetical protein P692DRAFT_20831822 [Suillus brevipes Sb2]|nr:hypothetical protein P692DRAFT_20831822 [Suillus brevipes Sb2]
MMSFGSKNPYFDETRRLSKTPGKLSGAPRDDEDNLPTSWHFASLLDNVAHLLAICNVQLRQSQGFRVLSTNHGQEQTTDV